ncbi:inositol monophosphatase [Acidipila sp. EB88]|uniref:inositol monophosphatase family protein n=1 Tax=Acidipila sp. EB88 TaxID=2305226 RepID=UPI000F5EEE4B|nr:inositol monophosphatase [Acidipila sp. EB88]RRA47666.1 inositol monophosphatase [Acidipila sp. EB88]
MSNLVPSLAPNAAISQRFDMARQVIREAGTLANDYFREIGKLTVKSKGSHDLVSEADVNTEKLIREKFAMHFPDDAFFGEESGLTDLNHASGTWVIDPIDGTQPFLSGMPNWCVSIAFVWSGVLQFGLIYNPPHDELFTGGKGFPAYVNDVPIRPSTGTDFSAGLVSIGFSPRSPHSFLFDSLTKLLAGNGMFYRSGSGALSLVYVGAGRLLGHVEPHMHSWDCLGAIAIIEAAGGKVNAYLVGDALLKGNRVIAGAPGVFDQLCSLLERGEG